MLSKLLVFVTQVLWSGTHPNIHYPIMFYVPTLLACSPVYLQVPSALFLAVSMVSSLLYL